MFKAFKYRLYPSKKQTILLNKHIGANRFLYNIALETKQSTYAGAQVNLPKFKKKGIKVKLHRNFDGEVKQATISKTKTGKFYVSVLVDTKKTLPKKAKITESTAVGIDLGLNDFICTSEGEVVNNPRHLKKALSRLKFRQKKYSRYKGNKTKARLAKQHELVANARRDFLHQLSTRLIRENQTICLEDLNITGMMSQFQPKQDGNGTYLPNGQAAKNELNRSIADASWSMFVEMLTYKAEWHGKNIVHIGRFEPSSKTCSSCGHIKKDMTLKDRNWTCESCGAEHHRDINAAKNIKAFALSRFLSGTDRKNHEELPTLVGALTHEAHPIVNGVDG